MARRVASFRRGDRVLVWGWLRDRPLDGVPGSVAHVWVSGIGEQVFSVILDAPDEIDGTCLLDVTGEQLVRATSPGKTR